MLAHVEKCFDHLKTKDTEGNEVDVFLVELRPQLSGHSDFAVRIKTTHGCTWAFEEHKFGNLRAAKGYFGGFELGHVGGFERPAYHITHEERCAADTFYEEDKRDQRNDWHGTYLLGRAELTTPEERECHSAGDWMTYMLPDMGNPQAKILDESNADKMREELGPFVRDSEALWSVGGNRMAIRMVDAQGRYTKAYSVLCSLRCALEDYPILCEHDYSERQCEAIGDEWERACLRDRVEYCREADVSIFAARRDEIPGEVFDSLMECERFF